MDEDELASILSASRRNNGRDGLTGLLMYHDGKFLQCLEGPKDILMKTLIRIRLDKRHTGLRVLLDQESEERMFGAWEMGFESQLQGERLEGFVDIADKVEGATSSEAINDLIHIYFKDCKLAA
jgi:hypothetical protein